MSSEFIEICKKLRAGSETEKPLSYEKIAKKLNCSFYKIYSALNDKETREYARRRNDNFKNCGIGEKPEMLQSKYEHVSEWIKCYFRPSKTKSMTICVAYACYEYHAMNESRIDPISQNKFIDILRKLGYEIQLISHVKSVKIERNLPDIEDVYCLPGGRRYAGTM